MKKYPVGMRNRWGVIAKVFKYNDLFKEDAIVKKVK